MIEVAAAAISFSGSVQDIVLVSLPTRNAPFSLRLAVNYGSKAMPTEYP